MSIRTVYDPDSGQTLSYLVPRTLPPLTTPPRRPNAEEKTAAITKARANRITSLIQSTSSIPLEEDPERIESSLETIAKSNEPASGLAKNLKHQLTPEIIQNTIPTTRPPEHFYRQIYREEPNPQPNHVATFIFRLFNLSPLDLTTIRTYITDFSLHSMAEALIKNLPALYASGALHHFNRIAKHQLQGQRFRHPTEFVESIAKPLAITTVPNPKNQKQEIDFMQQFLSTIQSQTWAQDYNSNQDSHQAIAASCFHSQDFCVRLAQYPEALFDLETAAIITQERYDPASVLALRTSADLFAEKLTPSHYRLFHHILSQDPDSRTQLRELIETIPYPLRNLKMISALTQGEKLITIIKKLATDMPVTTPKVFAYFDQRRQPKEKLPTPASLADDREHKNYLFNRTYKHFQATERTALNPLNDQARIALLEFFWAITLQRKISGHSESELDQIFADIQFFFASGGYVFHLISLAQNNQTGTIDLYELEKKLIQENRKTCGLTT